MKESGTRTREMVEASRFLRMEPSTLENIQITKHMGRVFILGTMEKFMMGSGVKE